MVGVRKIAVDKQIVASVPILKNLLMQYFIVEISGEGAPEHLKAGISPEKVLVKAYGKRQRGITA